MLGVFAEFETNLRRERQAEGIAAAKQRGAYRGRPPSIDMEAISRRAGPDGPNVHYRGHQKVCSYDYGKDEERPSHNTVEIL